MRPAPGVPAFDLRGASEIRVRGDVTLYLWSAIVDVTESQRVDHYRTGEWTENATGSDYYPGGAVRDDYLAFLRLELRGADLVLTQARGRAVWSAGQTHLDTQGTLRLDGARGVLRTDTESFVPVGDTVQLKGSFTQDVVQPVEGDPGFVASMVGRDVEGDLAFVARIAAPAREVGPLSLLGWLALAVLATAGVKLGRRYATPVPEEFRREIAHGYLQDSRHTRARWHARRLLRRDPQDADAWFVVVASHLRQGRYARVVRILAKRPAAVREHPPVAFVLGSAYHGLHRPEASRPWIRRAVRDPTVRGQLAASPFFHDLLRDELGGASAKKDHPTGYV